MYDIIERRNYVKKKLMLVGVIVFTVFITGCDLFKSDIMDDIDIYTTIYPVNYLITYL